MRGPAIGHGARPELFTDRPARTTHARLHRGRGGCLLEDQVGELCRRVPNFATIVITLDDLEYSYPDDGDQCYYCGRKWDSHSPWESLAGSPSGSTISTSTGSTSGSITRSSMAG